MNYFLSPLLKPRFLPGHYRLEQLMASLTSGERVVVACASILFALGAFFLFNAAASEAFVQKPAREGMLTEGVVGAPRLINPLLATTATDRDLTALIYSGLMRSDGGAGYVLDLADTLTQSEDGLIYTATVREDATFHDGEPVRASDILFTVALAQNNAVASTQRTAWEGVTAEALSDTKIRFTLEKPFASFINNLTLGIVPEHLWSGTDPARLEQSKLNVAPIGSGPYRMTRMKSTRGDVPISLTLETFHDSTRGEPYLPTIVFSFFPNENELLTALERGAINTVSTVSPSTAKRLSRLGYRTVAVPLPRTFGVFFNQNRAAALSYTEVRAALAASVDREELIRTVLAGYATPATGPLPTVLASSILDHAITPVEQHAPDENNTLATHATPTERRAYALELLTDNNWRANEATGILEKKAGGSSVPLAFTIATADTPELVVGADVLAETWRALGADVSVKIFTPGSLNHAVIRPREYDALLFGEVVGRDSDVYAFWHSSQRNDPGLNIALYANITADALLERIRTATSSAARAKDLARFTQEIHSDTPAAFLYTPDFIYIVPDNLHGLGLAMVSQPSDRFARVHEWYVATEPVLSLFTH